MKKILSASVMLAAMTGAAFAADLPSRVAPPVYAPPPLPTFTWSGAYFGLNAGYAFGYDPRFNTVGNTAANNGVATGNRPGSAKLSSDGFTGGGQLGYNYQFGNGGMFGGQGGGIVVGVEADAAYTDLSTTKTFASPITPGVTSTFRSGLSYLGTVRGRAGVAFGQFLVYGTGGFAYGDVYNKGIFTNAAGTTNFIGSRDSTKTGFVYGGGVEYALPTSSFLNFFKSSAVTIKAEYLHYDLGSSNIQLLPTAAGAGSYSTRVKNEGDLARIGLNYKFGSY